jgi:hypothetical protein
MAHTEIGFAVIRRAIEELDGMGHPDNDPRLLGKQINVMISPHPANKRKLKFHTRTGATLVAIPVQLGPMAVVAAPPAVKPAPGA